ncbi:MAG: Polysaccharide biosynthesis protein [Candidatus Curtissbacteria bacterium GW2011_GWA1_40_16]|uniref:Polysaccharide biosynthesis protein n=1 Tax=Candidatus Curtissbacteria bacterium GW2011_GWA1_40_16 TaxID=1618405 RepID=A0A0G0UMH4_9BACT|nr:MAG: Polysaccharide biosynthesis protein [Candidatus Curtissbacteria bacterium GW2011_GWA1_40_16]
MEDPEYSLDIELIKKKAISGVVTFTLRTFFIQAFTFFATFILTILLAPSVFGIFFVVSALLNFFVYFSDVGLAAALIQKKEEPTRKDLVSTFTIQQVIIFTLVILGLVLSPKIASFYNLDSNGLLLLRVLIVSLIFSSLKTVPSILLERHLSFSKLVIPQIAENIVFYATAVILAYNKFQIASFTWAVFFRGITGLVLIYLLSPWKPGIGIDKESAKKLTSFGVPFQVNSILALFKDDMLTVFLGKILTFTQIGYIGWAQKWAFTPLRFFMDNVNKVTFPAYSRLQDHKAELAKAIEKSIFFVTFLVYPSVFGMVAIAPRIVSLVPNYGKWEPALPLLYLFAVNALFSAVSTTFTNTLFAIGRPKIVLKFMAFWTAATWLLTVPLVLRFGYVGVAMASAMVSVTSLATIYFVKKEIPVTIARNIFGPLVVSLIMFFVVKTLIITFPNNVFGMLLSVILGAGTYLVISLAIFRRHLVEDATIIAKSIILKG